MKDRFLSKVEITDSCWLWIAGKYYNGYGAFCFKGRNRLAHRVSYELFKGPIPEGLKVCHSCDVPSCVNPEHLWLGTAFDNTQDCISKGRMDKIYNRQGHLNPNSKLQSEDIIFIRKSNLSAKELSKLFDINRSYIYRIRKAEKWPHIGVEL